MSLHWRLKPLFLIALFLAVSGITPQDSEAQVSGPDFKGDTGFDSRSQAPPGAQRDIFLNRYRIREINGLLGDQTSPEPSLDPHVPRFDPNNSGGLEVSYARLVNQGEHADQNDHSSTQAVVPLLVANAPSQVLPELLVDSNPAGTSDAGLPLPNPPNPSDQGWHFSISPYLWLPGLHGTIGALGHDASVHASFRDIFSNFSFGLMAVFDPRYNRIVMPLDFMWIKLTNDKALPFDVLATTAKVKVNLDVLTQKVGYRVVDAEKFKVEALAGIRYWHVGNTLDLESSVLTTTSFYGSANWVDAVGGARLQAMLAPKLVLTIAGDAGGGGANSDYQVGGLIGWKLKRIILQAGYRYLTVNYRPGGTILDVTISGLILGTTIPLK